jgi:general stress protein 26
MGQMSSPDPARAETDPKARILAILDANRVMAVATMRPDGWPQATLVCYVHDDLDLFFVVAQASQKLANIARHPRISIALGQELPSHLRGLSMAALAEEVTDTAEIERLNALILERYPEQTVFAPRMGAVAVLRAHPEVISVVDLGLDPGEPELFEVTSESALRRCEPSLS